MIGKDDPEAAFRVDAGLFEGEKPRPFSRETTWAYMHRACFLIAMQEPEAIDLIASAS